jgi:Na+-driven multidrug efflux pump
LLLSLLLSTASNRDHANSTVLITLQLSIVLGMGLTVVLGVGMKFGAGIFTKDIDVIDVIHKGIPVRISVKMFRG